MKFWLREISVIRNVSHVVEIATYLTFQSYCIFCTLINLEKYNTLFITFYNLISFLAISILDLL